LNSWPGKVVIGAIGALLGAGGLWLTRHDVGVANSARQDAAIEELKAFRERIDRNVEEWRRDQTTLRNLEEETRQSRKERAALFQWATAASATLHIAPPIMPILSRQKEPSEGVIAGEIGGTP
jgi:transposase-like protein